MKTCVKCGNDLIGGQKKYCSNKCNFSDKNERLYAITKTCLKCGKGYKGRSYSDSSICRSCTQLEKNVGHWGGDKNPRWRGGFRYWKEGRFGVDKNGLSWKRQRRLALERDNYSCVDCGKTRSELDRNPDVDHDPPYCVSQSHALDGLFCRCRSCHHKAEARRPVVWEGKSLGDFLKERNLNSNHRSRINKEVEILKTCAKCGKSFKRSQYNNLCFSCGYASTVQEKLDELKDALKYVTSKPVLCKYFGISERTLYYWMKKVSS